MNRVSLVLLLAAASLVVSCSHAPPAPEGETAADEGPVVGPPDVAWADMTKEQKGRFMKARVLPRFKELMAAFEPEEHEEITCATCHGEGAKDKTFKMPNADLEVLPGSQEGWERLSGAKPEWVKFMNEKVKPEVATLLGLPAFDPASPQEGAFGCGGCHTMEGK